MHEPLLGWAVLGGFIVWRLVEVLHAGRNVHALLARGGRVAPNDFTGVLVLLHTATFAGIATERYLLGMRLGGAVSWLAAGVLLLALAARLWTLGTLGRRWTIRVVTIAGEAPILRGPYRYLRHPNYLVVMIEVLALPAFFHAWWTLGLGAIPHLVALRARIAIEERAWREASLRSAARP